MASKIFMGDMPELMENILNNLNNELDSLYSCALVNRHWCKMSIPILWQNPFSIEKRSSFISKYFSSLAEDDTLVLKECGLNAEFSKTLYNYARFLKILDLSRLENKVKEWINPRHDSMEPYFFDSWIEPPYDYSLMNHIINLLLKLFIESGATLHKLDLNFSNYVKIGPKVFYSLGENKQFFSRLRDLSLVTRSYAQYGIESIESIESITTLIRILAKNTTKISDLKLYGIYAYKPQLFHALICIINAQEQLRQFSLIGERYLIEFYAIILALESQKNSLQKVVIENCAYNTEFEVLKNCKRLEILHIRCCDAKLLNILNYKFSVLEIVNCSISASTIVQILEESGILLQRFKFEPVNFEICEESLLEAIKSFCPNITYLSILNIGLSEKFLELIGNLQNLQFLTLQFIFDIPEEQQKIRIMQFVKILPLTLQYLDLYNTWLEPHLDILLKHCSVPLKKLLIYHLYNEKNTKALIEFCIRNKSLNYVGVFNYLYLSSNIRKEVEAYVKLVPYGHILVNC